jgi:hypothetical protein
MWLLYVDESGGVKEVDQRHYVLAGVAAHEKQPYFMQKEFDQLQQMILPSSNAPIEFHASAIRNGNGEPWQSMDRKDREALLMRAYEKIAATADNVSIFAVVMEKASFTALDPVQKTCEELAGHFDAFLEYLEARPGAQKERGLMVFDESNHEKTLHALIEQYRNTGASFGRVRRLAEIPMFTDSRLTRMLQIADLVAYAVFRRYEHGDSKYLDIILHKFHQTGGKIHSLMHLNRNKDSCFCPGCMSRRSAKGSEILA